MDYLDIKSKTTQLIDELKATCQKYGMGNDGNEYKIKNMANSELFVERYGKLVEVYVNETVSLENNDNLTFFGYNGDDSISISMTVKMEWEKKNKIRNEVI